MITTVVPLNDTCVPFPNLLYIDGNEDVPLDAEVLLLPAEVVVVADGLTADDEEPQCSSGNTPMVSSAKREGICFMKDTVARRR